MLQRETNHIDLGAIEERADFRSAEDFRRLARYEEECAEAADLPLVRDKHRMAARSWIAIARSVERAERLCGRTEVVLAN